MRISDWSSDVCSSDLHADAGDRPHLIRIETRAGHGSGKPTDKIIAEAADKYAFAAKWTGLNEIMSRSEEHTSELQSLMRISYAVFCLKKKKHTHTKEKHRPK